MPKTHMDNPVALIVDDEPDILELLTITMKKMNIDTICANSLASAQKCLHQQQCSFCLTDMRLPDGNGIDLVKHIQHNLPHLPVAVITAHGNMESAIAALKSGAFDFVCKPVELNILRSIIRMAIKLNKRLAAKQYYIPQQLLGNSTAIDNVRSMVHKVARSQAPIFISGASGTGKELVARLIHEQGPRAEYPFIPVNCGAIPDELMESEFFGHTKGSFTGASDNKNGLFQAANQGTLFLDEVADLPMHMQVKLLRAIQEKAIRPVGATKEILVDVRILSATHKNLNDMVENGQFRQDLFYRINVIEIKVPTLLQRNEDIPLIANHFLEEMVNHGYPSLTLSEQAQQALMQYSFPGNIRELENILERAATLCENNIIESGDLGLPEVNDEKLPQKSGKSLDPYLNDLEKNAIIAALEKTRWNKTAAAKLLGISFRALRYRLQKLGIDD